MLDWLAQHPSAIVILGAVGFLVYWVLLINLVALLSGWKKLAQRFRTQGEFPGSQWSWQSARMRFGTNYNNCLTVGADQAGLFVRPMILFRPGQPPLFIPWIEISVQSARILLTPAVELRLGRTEEVPFRIRPVLAERLEAAAGPSWPGVSSAGRI